MFKKLGVLFCTAVVAVSLTACGGAKEISKTNNTFTGEAEGKNGPIKVEVTIENNEIQKIDVLDSKESEFTDQVFEDMIATIVEANTAEVDAISGATVTSSAIIAAVADAVAKSGVELTAKAVEEKAVKVEDVTTDVVVVGAGGAGFSAAIEAKEQGAKVILIEKNAVVGGNTSYATGGLNAAETSVQKTNEIEDSVELFIEDTMKGGKNLNDPELVKVLAENGAETVEWLIEMGADLTDIGRMGGASANRAHRPTGGAPVGNHLVKTLEAKAKAIDLEVRTQTRAIELVTKDGAVTGVKVEDGSGNQYTINAEAVVITTGGFGANQEKVVEFDPALKGFGTTNGPGATGDALDLVKPLNVALVDMTQIQTHPTVVPKKNKLITEAVRGNGAILVNRDAKRFIDELETRDTVSEAELEQEGGTGFLVFDQNVRESLSAIEKYHKAGLLTEANSVAELAEAMGVDAKTLEETVATYNTYVEANEDADFGRSTMTTTLSKAPYYAVEVGPAVHHTMGGLKINTQAQVINEAGEVIDGLYAAGEVTGGVHGANRLGGNALADITTYGRIAGANAAAESVEK
ncbi:MAG: flavocytochrome c [Tissierellales bacterium]|nr:flavocytochrome c [Tissierellales bacterium]